MSLYRKTVVGVVWSVVERFGQELSGLIVLIVLARVLEPADFGLFAMAQVAIRFMNLFQASGFTSAIVQRQEIDDDHLNSAFWVNIASSCVLAATLAAGAGAFAAFFDEPRLAEIVRWLSLVLVLGGLGQVQMQLLRRRMRFKALASRTLIATPISGAVAIVAALSGLGVWSLVLKHLSLRLVMLIVCWRVGGWRPGFSFSLGHARELISFGMSMMGANAVNFLRQQGANIVIGHFMGATALGLFNIAVRVLHLTREALVGALGVVVWPMFARLQGEVERLGEAYRSVVRFSAIAALPTFAGIALVAPYLLPVAFGEQWLASVPVLQILALQGIVESLSHYNETVLNAIGRPHVRLLAVALSAGAGLPAIALAAQWGVTAVAVACVFEAALLALLGWYFVRRLTGMRFRPVWTSVRGAFAATALMAGVVLAAILALPRGLTPLAELLLLAVGGAAAYVLTLALVDRAVLADVRAVWALASRRSA